MAFAWTLTSTKPLAFTGYAVTYHSYKLDISKQAELPSYVKQLVIKADEPKASIWLNGRIRERNAA